MDRKDLEPSLRMLDQAEERLRLLVVAGSEERTRNIFASLSKRLANLTTDQATIAAHADTPMMAGARPCSRDDAIARLAVQMDALSWKNAF